MLIRPRKAGEFFEIFWRRKRTFFLMTLVMLIATYFIIRRIPSLYESSAMISVTSLSLPDNLSESTTLALSQSSSFASVRTQLLSRGNLATLVNRYKLYPQIKDLEAAAGYLEKEIKLDVKMRGYFPDVPESLKLSYRYSDPGIAQKVMTDLVGNFDQANQLVRQQATSEVGKLNEKIREIEGRLRQIAPQENLETVRMLAASRMATESTTNRSERMNIQLSIESLNDKEYALKRNIADLQLQIAEQEKILKSRTANPAVSNPALGALYVRRSELEAQIKVYLTQYTERNPKIITAREQLGEIARQIEKLEAAGAGDSSLALSPETSEIRRMRQEVSRLETDLDVVRRELTRKNQSLSTIPLGSGGGTFLPDEALAGVSDANKPEYDRLVMRYNSLLDKQDAMTKLSGVTGTNNPMFRIIDMPQRPESPVAPNRLLLQVIALILSLVFGSLFVMLFEFPRMFMLNEERDVEYYLGAPVLALIPETNTPIERMRNRRLRLSRGMILLLLAVALIPALIVVLNMMQLFQLLGRR